MTCAATRYAQCERAAVACELCFTCAFELAWTLWRRTNLAVNEEHAVVHHAIMNKRAATLCRQKSATCHGGVRRWDS